MAYNLYASTKYTCMECDTTIKYRKLVKNCEKCGMDLCKKCYKKHNTVCIWCFNGASDQSLWTMKFIGLLLKLTPILAFLVPTPIPLFITVFMNQKQWGYLFLFMGFLFLIFGISYAIAHKKFVESIDMDKTNFDPSSVRDIGELDTEDKNNLELKERGHISGLLLPSNQNNQEEDIPNDIESKLKPNHYELQEENEDKEDTDDSYLSIEHAKRITTNLEEQEDTSIQINNAEDGLLTENIAGIDSEASFQDDEQTQENVAELTDKYEISSDDIREKYDDGALCPYCKSPINIGSDFFCTSCGKPL